MCFAPQRRALFWHFFDIWTSKSGPRPSVFNTFDLEMCFAPTTACTFSTSQLPKVVRPWCVLYILTWKCASRHNGMHFFDIATSKSGPRPSVFNTFDLEMCFAPQRRALFRHRNFQKCVYLSINLSIYRPIYLSICFSVSVSLSLLHLSSCLAAYLSIYLSVYMSICGAVSFSVM